MTREVFVVSDLHLGALEPRCDCFKDSFCEFVDFLLRRTHPVELVINGDFVDFLSIETIPGKWEPFRYDIADATAALKVILDSNMKVFAALKKFLTYGNKITVIIGNHDLELSLPSVRRIFESSLGTGLEFLYDGEAYTIADAVIEHGNRYDCFNIVNHDSLRQARSLLSRKKSINEDIFIAPCGSYLVAETINAIKINYPFIDLIKPESTAVVPLLLALAPEHKSKIRQLLKRAYEASFNELKNGTPTYLGNLASIGGATVGTNIKLREKLTEELYIETNRMFPGVLEPASGLADLSSCRSKFETVFGHIGLMLDPDNFNFLTKVFKSLTDDSSFDLSTENNKEILAAATSLIDSGFKYVIFGHTHLKKNVAIGEGTYLNSGSWHPYIDIKGHIITDGIVDHKKLALFLQNLKDGKINEMIIKPKTFVRLLISENAGKVLEAEVTEAG